MSQERSGSFAKREVDYNSIRPLHFGRGDQIWLKACVKMTNVGDMKL